MSFDEKDARPNVWAQLSCTHGGCRHKNCRRGPWTVLVLRNLPALTRRRVLCCPCRRLWSTQVSYYISRVLSISLARVTRCAATGRVSRVCYRDCEQQEFRALLQLCDFGIYIKAGADECNRLLSTTRQVRCLSSSARKRRYNQPFAPEIAKSSPVFKCRNDQTFPL